MTLNHTPNLYVFAFSSVDEPIADAIRKDAAAKSGASDYRRRLCLGFEPLTTSALKGKARSYVSKIREAEKLLADAAHERGYNLIEVIAADRCKHWAIVPRDFDFAAAVELLAAEKAELAAAKKADKKSEAAAAKAAAKAAPARATGPASGFPPFAR